MISPNRAAAFSSVITPVRNEQQMDFHLLFFLIFRAGKGRWGYNTGSCYGEALLSIVPRSTGGLPCWSPPRCGAAPLFAHGRRQPGRFSVQRTRFAWGRPCASADPLSTAAAGSHWPWAVLGGVLLFPPAGAEPVYTRATPGSGCTASCHLMVRLIGLHRLPPGSPRCWPAGIFLLSTGGVMRTVIGDLYDC